MPHVRYTKRDLADILEETVQSHVDGPLTIFDCYEVIHAVADALRGDFQQIWLLAEKHTTTIGIEANGQTWCHNAAP